VNWEDELTRRNEWYVPKFGPHRFRLFIGMTFIPYTLMNVSYVVIGSMLTPSEVHWDRVIAIAVVYLLSVGVSAHALDALAPNKPWGAFLTKRQLEALAALALAPALVLGLYCALSFAPWLIAVGLAELFFLLSYNLELFRGRFHSETWFAFSWGFLPVVAGFVLQTNSLSPLALVGALLGFTTAYVEINASKPYKVLKRQPRDLQSAESERRFERILKGVVASVLTLAALQVLFRLL
jgi:hypothetical protein